MSDINWSDDTDECWIRIMNDQPTHDALAKAAVGNNRLFKPAISDSIRWAKSLLRGTFKASDVDDKQLAKELFDYFKEQADAENTVKEGL